MYILLVFGAQSGDSIQYDVYGKKTDVIEFLFDENFYFISCYLICWENVIG